MTRARWIVLTLVGAVVIAALIIGGFWLAGRMAAHEPDASASPAESVPPTPSVFPTPSPGSTDTAPSTAEPIEVAIDEVATAAEGVTVEVVSMTGFDSKSEQPGDLAGPALRVELRVTNASGAALDLNGASVNLSYGAGDDPAPPLGDPIKEGLPASIGPGDSATGVYLFSIPVDVREQVAITLDLLVGEPVVVFRGSAPTA